MSKNDLLVEVNGSSDLSHQNPPASSGYCLSLTLAAVVSDQLNGLETLWGLPSLLLIINCSARHCFEFFKELL